MIARTAGNDLHSFGGIKSLARAFAEQADEMEYSDGQAQTVLSHIYLMDGQIDAALEAGRKAVANRPACSNANGFFGLVLHYCGENDEAIRYLELAMKFQPLHPPMFPTVLAAAYLAKGLCDRALEIAQGALEIAPKDVAARVIMIGALMRLKQPELAQEVVSEIQEIDAGFSVERYTETQSRLFQDSAFPQQMAGDLLRAGLRPV